jgi:HTH-type transcriptional regulator, osmoprotectant uptake regulator
MVTTDHHILEDVRSKVTHEFSKTIEMFGLSPQDARLFATLYLNRTPMTLDEMSEALGKSKTAMSTGVRALLDQGLVERVWKKGVRKDLYQANENLYRNFMSTYIKKWQEAAIEQKNVLSVMKGDLKDRIQQYSDQEKMQHADDLYQRMQDMINFHKWIAQAFDGIDPNRE